MANPDCRGPWPSLLLAEIEYNMMKAVAASFIQKIGALWLRIRPAGILSILGLSALSLGLAACATNLGGPGLTTPNQATEAAALGPSGKSHRPVKIAMLLPLGGFSQSAAVAKSMKQAGEMALFDHLPRSATATALEDTVLLEISHDQFFEVMATRLGIMQSIVRTLSLRVRAANEQVAELSAHL